MFDIYDPMGVVAGKERYEGLSGCAVLGDIGGIE